MSLDWSASPDATRVTYRVQLARTAARQLTEQLRESVAAACVEFLYGLLTDNPLAWQLRYAGLSRATGALTAGNTESGIPSTTVLRPSKFSTSATSRCLQLIAKPNDRFPALMHHGDNGALGPISGCP